MQYLYLDNFRGFKNTYFPIDEVNFLVGENSTGKSSMLGILKLIFSPQFWFQCDFNMKGINFGLFDDIVSINSKNRKYFTVGFIQGDLNKKQKIEINAFLMTFTEKDGMPWPFIYIHYHDSTEVRICFKGRGIKYKVRSVDKLDKVEEFIKKIYKQWTKEHVSDRKNYKNIPPNLKTYTDAPPMIIASILEEQSRIKKKRVKPTGIIRTPIEINNIAWIAPVRTKPRRTYDEYKLDFSPEGDHTPYLIKKILQKQSRAKEFVKFIKQVGQDSGLFENIIIKEFGKGVTAPFELDIILNKKALNINSVGYGVSQSLPVIVDLFAEDKEQWYAIQQPEIHLHPKAQAALGDLFFELAIREKKVFFVETHSDHTIDRFRLNYRRKSIKNKPNAQLLYFERRKDGNSVYQLSINNKGELPTDQPKGYRDFFIKEDLKLLGL